MPVPRTLFGTTRSIPGPTRGENGWEAELNTLLCQLTDGVDGLATLSGTSIFPYLKSVNTTLTTASTLTPTAPLHKLTGSGGPVTIGGIAVGTKDGQLLTLVGNHATNFVTILATATNVNLLGGDITLEQYEEIQLRWDETSAKWIERIT